MNNHSSIALRPNCSILTVGLLTFLLIVTSGCEMIWIVPPANGRVLDSRSQRPIADATITRVSMSGQTNQTTSNVEGQFKFHGKRSVQIIPFGDVLAWATYRIEAPDYQTVETNRAGYGSVNGLRHEFGEIRLSPKQLPGL